MGCTTSVSNTLPINANTADKSIQFEEETNENPPIEVDVADIEEENRNKPTKVLPDECDTTEQPVYLDRNNKSANSLDILKDVPANGHFIDSEDVTEAILKPPKDEVKKPKLELFMDKVFETNHHLNEIDNNLNNKMKHDEENPPADTTEELESVKNDEEAETKNEPESNNNGNKDNNDAEESVEVTEEGSPSQSQSSRATRWEALADIAAELPPSLAVDPITGQIYQIAQPK